MAGTYTHTTSGIFVTVESSGKIIFDIVGYKTCDQNSTETVFEYDNTASVKFIYNTETDFTVGGRIFKCIKRYLYHYNYSLFLLF